MFVCLAESMHVDHVYQIKSHGKYIEPVWNTGTSLGQIVRN